MAERQPVFVLHDHRKPAPHFDLRLEEDGVLKSWAVPRGLPTDSRHDRLAVQVGDHDLDHATYTDEHKSIADAGWWELEDRTAKRFVFVLLPRRRTDHRWSTTQSMQVVRASTSEGSMAGYMAMRSWLRPSLR